MSSHDSIGSVPGARCAPVAGVLSDPHKRTLAAQILGQAYIKAHHLMAHNREGIELVAGALIERKELYGDELVELLESANLTAPEIDLLDENSWPRI